MIKLKSASGVDIKNFQQEILQIQDKTTMLSQL
jgi:hypothetical protein